MVVACSSSNDGTMASGCQVNEDLLTPHKDRLACDAPENQSPIDTTSQHMGVIENKDGSTDLLRMIFESYLHSSSRDLKHLRLTILPITEDQLS